MSCLSEDVIQEIQEYIEYVDKQESSLNEIETEKKELLKTFFTTTKKEENANISIFSI
jgi:hypothetical protein